MKHVSNQQKWADFNIMTKGDTYESNIEEIGYLDEGEFVPTGLATGTLGVLILETYDDENNPGDSFVLAEVQHNFLSPGDETSVLNPALRRASKGDMLYMGMFGVATSKEEYLQMSSILSEV